MGGEAARWKKRARAKEGGVWWSGGIEPENCIACSVISLPPGSHSLSLPSSHSPGSFLPLVAFPCVFVLPLSLPHASFHFLCHYITLSLLSILSSYCLLSFTFLAVISTDSPLYLRLTPHPTPLFSSLCADLLLPSSGLEICVMPPNASMTIQT